MELIATIAVTASMSFVLGVVFSALVLSDLTAVKKHITEEVSALRAEVSSALSTAAKKV